MLKLRPLEEREELDEGYTKRGSLIHEILERFEKQVIDSGSPEDVDDLVPLVIDRLLSIPADQASDLETGLRTMERRWTQRIMDFYLSQREDYANQGETRAVPRFLEQDFGVEGAAYPMLEISAGDRVVRLRGKIDRIDMLESPSGRLFRVIDYKSGSVPTTTEVKKGEMVQLVLYAMAAERLMLASEAASPAGVGYWGLKKEGYKELVFPNWQQLKEDVVAHILGVVERIREGVFAVDSRKPGCESYCDFRSICRIRQVRLAGKRQEDEKDVQLAIQTRRKRSE